MHHPYRLRAMNRVNNHCNFCGQKLKLEPSFYYGSMYVSYAIGVAIAVAVFVLGMLAGLEGMIHHFVAITAVLIALMPYIGALAKSIWAHLFIHFDPKTEH
ncbi:MAG: DUF983 domain-containing protein [Flavobacteriaceae bacterium]